MKNLKIIRTLPGEKDFPLFEKLPVLLYPPGSPRFALPDTLNTEFLSACFVLLDGETPCARLALYRNPHLTYKGVPAACLGNYECQDDRNKAQELLRHALGEAKKMGYRYVIGPMNGSTWDNYRFNEDFEQALFFPETYHHPFYSGHFTKVGFEKIGGYFSALDTQLKYDDPKVLQREKALKEQGMTIRNISMAEYGAELEKLYPFISEAFKTNFLYTLIARETFMKKYLESEKLVDPEFVLIAEDPAKSIVGVFFCLHDFYSKTEKRLVIKTIARDRGKKWTGLGHVLANIIYSRAVKAGYSSIIHAFMYDEGTSTAISRNFSGYRSKTYSLFGIPL